MASTRGGLAMLPLEFRAVESTACVDVTLVTVKWALLATAVARGPRAWQKPSLPDVMLSQPPRR